MIYRWAELPLISVNSQLDWANIQLEFIFHPWNIDIFMILQLQLENKTIFVKIILVLLYMRSSVSLTYISIHI